jgi:hypothetical protein
MVAIVDWVERPTDQKVVGSNPAERANRKTPCKSRGFLLFLIHAT